MTSATVILLAFTSSLTVTGLAWILPTARDVQRRDACHRCSTRGFSDSFDKRIHGPRSGPRFSVVEPDIVDVKATSSSTKELKYELLYMLTGTNRGLNIEEGEKRAVNDAIQLLEAENPNPRPCDGFASRTSPLTGDWRLIFTNAIDVLSLGLLPVVVLGRVYQNVNHDGTVVTNVAELQPGVSQLALFPVFGQLGDSTARLKVEARSDVVSPSRITLTFQSARFVPLKVCGIDVENTLPQPKVSFRSVTNQGYVETTYVDQDMRIGRSPGGSVFVFAREK